MPEPMFDRDESDSMRVTLEWKDGLSWIAHPTEPGQRSSHAVRTADGVWLFDPIDAPGIDERVRSLGEVTGVAVCSRYHTRDAETFARRYDVSIHTADWIDRVEDRVDAPVRSTTADLDNAFRTVACRPLPIWKELCCYHEPSKTLIVPDSLGTIDPWVVGDERLGLELFRRLQPPRQLAALDPNRVLVGHGDPVTEDAGQALEDALVGVRRSFPRAALANGRETVQAIRAAI